MAAPHIKWKVGTGRGISFWFDNWTSLGPLSAYYQVGVACFPSLGPQSTMAEVLTSGSWVWPRSRDPQATIIIAYVNSHVVPTITDRVLWEGRRNFTPAQAYKDLRSVRNRVP